MHALLLAFLLAIALFPSTASAGRNLPDGARYGKLTRFEYPYATIGGKALHLAPGARIYNEQNLIIMPASMVQSARVLYRLDTAGDVSAMWILTEEEARLRAPKTPTSPPGASSPAGTAR